MQSGQAVNKSATLALVFDFDGTLAPDSTTQLLKAKNVDVDDFWKARWPTLVRAGWEPTLAYLKLILDLTKPGEKLEGLTNAELAEFGKTLDIYPGLPGFFGQLRGVVKETLPFADVRFWVISGGIEGIIGGCETICGELEGYWACRLAGDDDSPDSPIKYIKRAISFTEKTRYLFHINKGQYPSDVDRYPGIVNKNVPFSERPVPLHNVVYIGDGLTDIPCFSLILNCGGATIGIDDRKRDPSAKQEIIRDILFAQRTFGIYKPDYEEGSELRAAIEGTVYGICTAVVNRQAIPG